MHNSPARRLKDVLLITLLSAFVLLVAPKALAASTDMPSPLKPKNVSADEIWQKMTYEANHDEDGNTLQIQPNCQPTHYLPKTPKIGVAILLHGFSACPQQYYELGDKLSSEGYEVYMPLSPGHGRALNADGSEDLDGMPSRYNISSFTNFADEINLLAATSSGKRLIAGLSGGGAIAAYAMNTATVAYDRAVLMAPWFHAEASLILNITLFIERLLPLGFGLEVPWGDSCTVARAHGRDGYCSTLVANVAGAENFGQLTLFDLKKQLTQVQVVGVEGDKAVHVPTIVDAVHAMQIPENQVCFMPFGIQHSFFAPCDNVTDNPTWISPFERNFVRFAVDGTPFSQGAASDHVPGFHQCDVE